MLEGGNIVVFDYLNASEIKQVLFWWKWSYKKRTTTENDIFCKKDTLFFITFLISDFDMLKGIEEMDKKIESDISNCVANKAKCPTC